MEHPIKAQDCPPPGRDPAAWAACLWMNILDIYLEEWIRPEVRGDQQETRPRLLERSRGWVERKPPFRKSRAGKRNGTEDEYRPAPADWTDEWGMLEAARNLI